MYFFGNNSGTVEDSPNCRRNGSRMIHTRAQVFGEKLDLDCRATMGERSPRSDTTAFTSRHSPGDMNTPASAYGLDTGVSGPALWRLAAHQVSAATFSPELGGFNWPKVQGPDSHHPVHRSRLLHGGQARHQVWRRTASQRRQECGATATPEAASHFSAVSSIGTVLAHSGSKTSLRACPSSRRSRSAIRPCNSTTGHTAVLSRMTGASLRNLTVNFGVRYEYSTCSPRSDTICSETSIRRDWCRLGSGSQQSLQSRSQELRVRASALPGTSAAMDDGVARRRRHDVRNRELGIVPRLEQCFRILAAFRPARPLTRREHVPGGTIATGNVTIKNFLNPVPWDWTRHRFTAATRSIAIRQARAPSWQSIAI